MLAPSFAKRREGGVVLNESLNDCLSSPAICAVWTGVPLGFQSFLQKHCFHGSVEGREGEDIDVLSTPVRSSAASENEGVPVLPLSRKCDVGRHVLFFVSEFFPPHKIAPQIWTAM